MELVEDGNFNFVFQVQNMIFFDTSVKLTITLNALAIFVDYNHRKRKFFKVSLSYVNQQ